MERMSGILLHPTALPGPYGIGTLGKEAYHFVDWLHEAKQKVWQIFPLGPTGYGDSPYQCFSAFAGNPFLIDIPTLQEDGWIVAKDLKDYPEFSEDVVDFGPVIEKKNELLQKAFNRFEKKASDKQKKKFQKFCNKHSLWLDDYALFMAIKQSQGGVSWSEWAIELKMREPEALKKAGKKLAREIRYTQFRQWQFFKQWHTLKKYANSKDISIIGDIPIFVAFDSADAWSKSELFYFNKDKKPVVVAGVPPDYFSATGQLWGNPLYNWEKLKKTGYQWWLDRIQATLELVDFIRIDHFRGFSAFWAVPYGEETAMNGKWVKAPGQDFFKVVLNKLGKLPIIAEDLGIITKDVEALRDDFDLPGMKILQFAFETDEDNVYLPHHYPKNSAVYTGTHDNDTTAGWYQSLSNQTRQNIASYLHKEVESIVWDLIELAWQSKADLAIAPLQDFLELGTDARMNTPGVATGNWQWRFSSSVLRKSLARKIMKLTKDTNRI